MFTNDPKEREVKGMVVLDVCLDGDGAWADMMNKEIIEADNLHIAALKQGMKSGAPSVGFRIDLPNGRSVVFAQTSLALFLSAADIMRARYGDPRQ